MMRTRRLAGESGLNVEKVDCLGECGIGARRNRDKSDANAK